MTIRINRREVMGAALGAAATGGVAAATGGVAAGASMPYQIRISMPLKPRSPKVGTFGASGLRLALAAAIGRSLPDWMCGNKEGAASNITCTRPLATSTTAGPLPL